MQEKMFSVSGTYREKRGEKKFWKKVKAASIGFAREKTLSEIGSKHKAKRNHVKISEISEAGE